MDREVKKELVETAAYLAMLIGMFAIGLLTLGSVGFILVFVGRALGFGV